MKTGSKPGFLEVGARNTTGAKHFEGRGIDDGLTLLEMEGDEVANGHHSLGDSGEIRKQHHAPGHDRELVKPSAIGGKPITEVDPKASRQTIVGAADKGDLIDDSRSLDNDLHPLDKEEGFASAFASAPSLPITSFQRTKGTTTPSRIRPHVHLASALSPGRTPIPIHPFILRSLPKHSTTPLTQEQTTQLLRTLTQRDRSILQTLHDYRYLSTLQIRQLYFPSTRSTQLRVQFLKDQGLIYRWKMAEPPGITRRPSLLLISPRGARLLSDLHGESPWPYVRRAQDARDHCWHVVHDLEANGFFIDLALASRLALREGVLLWIGEETCRADRRLFAKENRRPVATPDGAGSYLIAGNVIHFDLEWDRGTASFSRLEKKARNAIRYFKDTRNAEPVHILFVLSRPSREEALRPIIQDQLDQDSCRFWTTTVERLEIEGPLGRLWCDARETKAEQDWPPPPRVKTATLPRFRLTELPPFDKSRRTISDCIGKPRWWERRPGGGEVL